MSLNSLYVLAPSPQVYFVDKITGAPLSGGFVYCYSDNSRSTLKTAYTLIGGVGTYSYTALPNPIPLSSVGTPTDGSNNDIIPYWYPHDADGNVENYYLVITDHVGNIQETRQAWPNVIEEDVVTNVFLYNYIRNSSFYSWSNLPSGIDGYTDVGIGSTTRSDWFCDDWIYSQDDASQTINLTRGEYGVGNNPVPTNSPYYLDYENEDSGSELGSYNKFQQYLQSVETCQGQQVIVQIWLKSVGSTNVNVSVAYNQHFGTGGSPSPDNIQSILDITEIPNEWTKFIGTATVDSTSGMILGTNGDDAFIIEINVPLNQTSHIQIGEIIFLDGDKIEGDQRISNDTAKQQTNFWALYPPFSTGDVKFTLKTDIQPGWLIMNDGTIGNITSGANYSGISTFALYSLIWTNVNSTLWAPIYTSAGALTTYGANALADWNANKRLSLTKQLGRNLAGIGSGVLSEPVTFNQSPANSVSFSNGAGSAHSFYTGTPVTFTGTLPPELSLLTTYYAIYVATSTITVATTLANAQNGAVITFSTGGTGAVHASLSSHVMGEFVGEYTHAQTTSELVLHSHAGSINIPTGDTNGGVTWITGRPSLSINEHNQVVAFNTSGSGGNVAMNVTQPTTFMNVMIKL